MTYCRNCAGQLVFDPEKQMLVCDHCGSSFKPEEFDVSEKIPLWDKKAESMNEVYGTDSEEFMDCYVYTCGSCGGEIIINGSEASTKCIYCGNSAVVFNRISRQKRPKYIIPFKVSKDEAVNAVRERFKKGLFIPKDIKNFKAELSKGKLVIDFVAELTKPVAADWTMLVVVVADPSNYIQMTTDMENADVQSPESLEVEYFADGLDGFGAALAELANFPEKAKVNTVRAFEDGDYVVCQTDYNFFGPKAGFDIFTIHKILGCGNFVLAVSEGAFAGKPTSYYDLFRVENGKIAEHWDVMETIAPESEWKHQNGKFNF
jgi:predicted SnoaL-like aldol condensation-catalyzing enzyme/DNA-directed RNA polymerase subunit RPC12/RpoP